MADVEGMTVCPTCKRGVPIDEEAEWDGGAKVVLRYIAAHPARKPMCGYTKLDMCPGAGRSLLPRFTP